MSAFYMKMTEKIDDFEELLVSNSKYNDLLHSVVEDRLKCMFVYYVATGKLKDEELMIISMRLNRLVNIGEKYD